MENIRIKIKPYLDKYIIFVILFFGLLNLLPYISFFKSLQVIYSSGIIYRGVLFVILLMFFLLLFFVYKTKIPKFLYVISLLYLISQTITIFVSPVIKDTPIPFLDTTMGLAQAIIVTISIYAYLTISNSSAFERKTINIACIIVIFFGLFLCLYSYIFEYEDIYHTFNTIYGWNYDVTSIFTMKTEYGFVLYVCSLFSIFYILNNKKYWMYVIPLFFLANMFISRSKTSILCTTIILMALLVVHVKTSWNKYKKYWLISFLLISLFVITIIFLTALQIGWFENFNYYITQVIFGDAGVVMNDRIHKWSLLLKAMDNPFNIILGYGERITPLILSDCGCATIGDNIYLSVYGVGGLIKLSLYITLIIFVMISTWKKGMSISNKIICLSIQLSFIVGGLFEDDSIIGVTYNTLFASIIFYSCNRIIKADLFNAEISKTSI